MKRNPKKSAGFWLFLTAVIASGGTIFYFSAQSGTESSAESGGFILWIFQKAGVLLSQTSIRTLAHFSEYALFGLLMCGLLFTGFRYLRPFLSALLAWGYAWTDEFHQLFVPGRAFQVTDLLVDLSGIVLGTLIFTGFAVVIQTKKRKKEQL